MRDSRITVITGGPVTITTDTTTNGATINFEDDRAGNFLTGTFGSGYGLGVELLLDAIGGTAFTVAVKTQVSDDDSTWVDDVFVLDALEIVAASANGAAGDNIKIPMRINTSRKHARVVVTTTSGNSGTFTLDGWVSDGTVASANGTTQYGPGQVRY